MAATTIPTVSASDLQAMMQGAGATGYGAPSAGQGLGSSYLSMLPAYLQGTAGGANGSNIIQDAQSGNDPVFNWLQQNGYLGNIVTDASGNTSIAPGYKAEGVQQGGTYNPTAATNIGSGYGADQGNQNLQLAGNNPFGVNTIGQQDVHELQSPTQNPSQFGTSPYGATVNKGNLAQNQDVWSKYLIPLMQAAASAGFGGLGGMGSLGSHGGGIFNSLGNAVTSGSGSPLATLGSIAGGALGSGLN